MSSLLSLQNLSLSFPAPNNESITVLHHVNLTIQSSDIISIVGPSGSGKSSLLMVMAGVQRPSEGTVSFQGASLNHQSDRELALWRGAHIGIVFQHFHLIPTMNARDNIALAMRLCGKYTNHPNWYNQLYEYLDAVGMKARADHYPHQLSGGEQQRVAIARALAMRPSLLLADEPTGNLDSYHGRMIYDLLVQGTRHYGMSLVYITHDQSIASRANHCYELHDGVLSCPG
jgi:putative ABC transport system ATP-binding protein